MSRQNGQPDPLTAGVGDFADANELIESGAGVLVAVSGGADSVALLAMMRELAGAGRRNWRLSVAHLDHGLRHQGDADAQFVAKLATRWSLPLRSERRDMSAEARRMGCGLEEACRTVRYEFLLAAATELGASYVAVGHHADDNVETILYRICRGTHLRGLAGMAASRPLGEGGVTLVRPLLSCRRQEIEAFCRRNKLQWRDDHTNEDTAFRRNFIRNELLPLLRDRLNPRVDDALLRLSAGAGQAEEYLLAEAAALLDQAGRAGDSGSLTLDRQKLVGAGEVLAGYAMRLALERLSVPFAAMAGERFRELAEMVQAGDNAPSAVALPGRFVARRTGDRIVIAPSAEAIAEPVQPAVLQCPGRTRLSDGREITCQFEPFESDRFAEHCRANPGRVELIDADQLCGPLTCRLRRDGDALHPLGSPGRQSVSNFLTNLKLPQTGRGEVLCICDDLGIVYLSPLRIDDRVKLTERTARVLRVSISGTRLSDDQ